VRRERSDNTLEVQVEPRGVASAGRTGVLTVLSGERPGTVIPIERELVIGRTDESDVFFGDESLSRRHARVFRRQGVYFVEDLASTNGTFVHGVAVSEAVPLEDGAHIQLGRATILRFTLRDGAELAERQRIYEATVRDALTGVYNRHFLDERLASELSFAKRHGTWLSVLFVDADHFKLINDEHGHAAGDRVLRAIAKVLQDRVRSEDEVARFGGEEFVVLIRGIDPPGVAVVADRLRASVEALEIDVGTTSLRVTVSIGVATQSPDQERASVEALLAEADAALYRAKEAGRNRVSVA
jgi:diguanylate cyclase (GGDEF)-like protein